MPISNVPEITNQPLNTGATGEILDQYTPIIGGSAFDLYHGLPRWLPAHFRRRIKTYQLLDKLYSGVDEPLAVQDDDATPPMRLGVIPYSTQVLRDLTLGGSQKIVVEGAAEEDAPDALVRQQKLLNQWAKRNLFFPKLQKAEELTTYLGDVFIKLRLGRTEGQRDPKATVIHPMFAFPEFNSDGEITTMTLIWEEYIPINGIDTLALYKDHYEIGPDGYVRETAGWYQYSTVPTLDDLNITQYETNDAGQEINELNLNLKIIPVYHIPNTWTHWDYGESDFAYFAQQAQELNACDTDLSAASRVCGIPPIVASDLKARVSATAERANEVQRVGPGSIINVGPSGSAQYLDNSKMLDALIKYADRLEDKFFRNIRLGKLFAGKTDHIRDIESQKAFKTLMATLYARIEQKRTVRDAVLARLLRGLREMLMLVFDRNDLTSEEMSVELGSILPLDNSDDLKVVGDAWQQGHGFISALTAAKLGAQAGTGVVDYKKEASAVLEQLVLTGKGGGSPEQSGDTKPAAKKFSLKPPPSK